MESRALDTLKIILKNRGVEDAQYEAVSNPSVPRVQHMYQNIPVSIFYKAFDEAQSA
jgi:hypothetical protein